jgi:hypothetical protein
MFKDKMIEFLNVMISKIKNISNFDTILELINIKKITKVDEFFSLLKEKYDKVVKKQIESLTDNEKELNKAVVIIAKFVNLLYIHEKNCNFIKENIDKLDKKISFLIYNELMIICKGDEYKEMKDLIYKIFLNNLENINSIIDLIVSLDKKDKKDKIDFLKELMRKCQFTKEEFYSKDKNEKIDLLCELNERKIIEKTEEQNYFEDIKNIIQDIYKDLDGEILIQKLEDFLENEQKQVKKRLGLINLIYTDFDPETEYEKLIEEIKRKKDDIDELNLIKNSLLIFYRNTYQEEIREISNIINDMQTNNLKNYKAEGTKTKIKKLKIHKDKVEEVESVKDFLLFKLLYNDALGSDQEKRFKVAIQKLTEIKELFEKNATANEIYQKKKDIFNKIKEMLMLSNSETKSKLFFEQMKKYFKIEEKQKDLMNDLTLIFKSKMYEMDLKSIFTFLKI